MKDLRKRTNKRNVRADIRERDSRKGNGVRGKSLLTVFAAAAGLLAIGKRIPLTNMIGDEGNAYFGIALDTCLFFSLFCSYAVQPVTAKMISARCAKGQYRNAARVRKTTAAFSVASGLIMTLLLVLLSDTLSGGLYLVPLSAIALKFIAPMLLLGALLGLLRGFFQGIGTMVPTIFSRFLEELVCLICMLLLAGRLGSYGSRVGALLLEPGYEQAFGAAGGVLGLSAGAAAGLIFLFLVQLVSREGLRKKERKDLGKGTESYRRIMRVYSGSCLPVLLMGLVLYGIVLLDQVLFLRLMPSSADTVVQWGIYSGKYRILSALPVTAVVYLCTGMIPALTVSHTSMNTARLREKAILMLKTALALAVPVAVYFAVMADSLIPVLFSAGDMDRAAGLLRTGSVAIVLQACCVAFSAILQGLEQERRLLIHAAIALVLHGILLYLLLANFGLEIQGVLYAVIAFYAVWLVLNLVAVLRTLSLRADWGRVVGIPVFASGLSGLVVFLMNRLLAGKIEGGGLVFLTFLIGLVLYLALFLAFHGMSERELKSLPGGGAVIFIGKAFRLM